MTTLSLRRLRTMYKRVLAHLLEHRQDDKLRRTIQR
jgi:hypothetical protein